MANSAVYTRPLLFDRLVGGRGEGSLRSLDRQALHDSVQRELDRLLNTRRSDRPFDRLGRRLTVVDYGIPDLAQVGPGSAADEERLGRLIQKAIEAFEPRLQRVSVRIERFREEDRALWARVDAVLMVDGIAEPVTFDTGVGGKSA